MRRELTAAYPAPKNHQMDGQATISPAAPIVSPAKEPGRAQSWLWERRNLGIAALALAGIGIHLLFRFLLITTETTQLWPLWIVLALGGVPLVAGLALKLVHAEFGSDLLAGISIVTAVILQQYLAGALVVLM